jgi:nucleotide-binding universal stress UspA family protein
MKILFAHDGSPQAMAALERLVGKFSFFRDMPRLTLIHVHPPIPYKAAAAWAGKETVARYYAEESEAALVPARDFLAARGVAFESLRRVGNPAEEIVAEATAGNYDMIAMGTHGHTALTNLVMGSVATRVVATSPVPVLLLK